VSLVRVKPQTEDAGSTQSRTVPAWHYAAHKREQPLAERRAPSSAERNAKTPGIDLWHEVGPKAPISKCDSQRAGTPLVPQNEN